MPECLQCPEEATRECSWCKGAYCEEDSGFLCPECKLCDGCSTVCWNCDGACDCACDCERAGVCEVCDDEGDPGEVASGVCSSCEKTACIHCLFVCAACDEEHCKECKCTVPK